MAKFDLVKSLDSISLEVYCSRGERHSEVEDDPARMDTTSFF